MAFGVLLDAEYEVVFGVAFFGIFFGAIFYRAFDVVSVVAYVLACVLGVFRVYFWLPELLWVGLLFLLTRQGRFASRLVYLPPYFDQSTHLPLPFMSTMLAEAYRENPNATRETIAYLTNSIDQKKVAARAIVNWTFGIRSPKKAQINVSSCLYLNSSRFYPQTNPRTALWAIKNSLFCCNQQKKL